MQLIILMILGWNVEVVRDMLFGVAEVSTSSY